MTKLGVQRKLTAIFSADVKGYSRLIGDDEVSTVRTITAELWRKSQLYKDQREIDRLIDLVRKAGLK